MNFSIIGEKTGSESAVEKEGHGWSAALFAKKSENAGGFCEKNTEGGQKNPNTRKNEGI